ncbi:MAG: hypothetical protein AAGH88_03865 [Planctomycetota bacterium]
MEMPKNVRILGVLNIVLASVGIFFSLVGVAGIFLMKELSPDMGKVYTGAVLAASVALPMVGLITKAMMLFSGIGLVRGQAFGRSLGIIWAWSSMFYGVIAAAINSFFVSPAAMEASMNNSSSASGGAAAPPAWVDADDPNQFHGDGDGDGPRDGAGLSDHLPGPDEP